MEDTSNEEDEVYFPRIKYTTNQLRNRKKLNNYTNFILDSTPHKPSTYEFDLEETFMTQYNVKKRLKVFSA